MNCVAFATEALVVGLVMLFLQRMTGLNVFWVGGVGHVLFEAVGANKWYCTKGVACR